MKNKIKTYFKIVIDFMMAVLYIILMFGYAPGAKLHEVLGLVLALLFVLHIVLNIKLIKSMFTISKSKNMSSKLKFIAFCDILLFILMPVIIITGIMISRVLFSNGMSRNILMIHNISSWICAVVMSVHIILHIKYIVFVIKSMVENKKDTGKALSIGAGVLVIILSLCFLIKPLNNSHDLHYQNKHNHTKNKISEIKKEDDNLDNDSTFNDKSFKDSNNENKDTPTLDEFLSKLFCNGCGRHCSLIDPECGKSSNEIQEATKNYLEKYSIS